MHLLFATSESNEFIGTDDQLRSLASLAKTLYLAPSQKDCPSPRCPLPSNQFVRA